MAGPSAYAMHACVSMIPSSASRWSSSTGGLCSCLPRCTLAGVREAAEKGYDRLSWTIGEQQAERYDLSHHIGRVQYDPDANELTAYDPHGHQVIEEKVDPDVEMYRPHNPRLTHLDRLPLRDSLLLSIRQSRQLDRANNGRWAAILRDSPRAYILLSATGASEARFCPPQRRVNGRVFQILYNNLAVNLEGEPWGT